MAGTPGSERTIGQLVADATHDFQGLVRSEIALAKAEVTSGAKDVGKGAGLLAAAAFFGLMGLVFLLLLAYFNYYTYSKPEVVIETHTTTCY